jgi:hypothetical protein
LGLHKRRLKILLRIADGADRVAPADRTELSEVEERIRQCLFDYVSSVGTRNGKSDVVDLFDNASNAELIATHLLFDAVQSARSKKQHFLLEPIGVDQRPPHTLEEANAVRAAIRYLNAAARGLIDDPGAIDTVASAFEVDDRTINLWKKYRFYRSSDTDSVQFRRGRKPKRRIRETGAKESEAALVLKA